MNENQAGAAEAHRSTSITTGWSAKIVAARAWLATIAARIFALVSGRFQMLFATSATEPAAGTEPRIYDRFTVTEATNWLRVFELPAEPWPSEIDSQAESGPVFVEFRLVDSFAAIDGGYVQGMEIELGGQQLGRRRERIRQIIRSKLYYLESRPFLVMTAYGDIFQV